MSGDLKYILTWWFIYFFLGTISLPLVFNLFKKYWDKGYIFSKIISTVVLTFVIFVLGVIHFLPFTNSSLLLIVTVVIIADIVYFTRKNNFSYFLSILKSKYPAFLLEELLFLAVLIAWSYVRGFAPDIEGLEKFMDWGFVNSALRSTYMPPADMWFSSSPINYYYFGHLIIAVITKLSGITSAVTYNLTIAGTCALTFVGGFSFASNLYHSLHKKSRGVLTLTAGLVSALFLTFGGNLHSAYKIAKIDIQDNKGHLVISRAAVEKASQSYWYPDATRFIGFDPDVKDKTIHEFPVYSFVVADLHGHMNDIPNVILYMAILLAFALVETESLVNWPFIAISGLLLSVNFMTNAWDFAVYGLLYAITFFLVNCKRGIKEGFIRTGVNGMLIIISWYLFSFPFSLNFTPMTEGLRLADAHSPFYQLFVLYGGFWLICLPFFLFFVKRLAFDSHFQFKKIETSDLFAVGLMLTATVLIILPEIGYIKDIYIYEHRRANTMFKLVYEAFIMYSLLTGYILVRFSRLVRRRLFITAFKLLFLIIMAVHLVYPYFAIKSFYGLTQYKGLWGLNWLKSENPDNYAAVEWINNNIKDQPVMLEAVGDSYTTFDQISIATGLPTVEGWIVHEWLWRGGYDKPAARQADVEKIYQSKDVKEVRSLLQKYSVDYIFVGDKEYEKYPQLNLPNFDKIGAQVVFESGRTKIYKLIK